MPPLIEPATPWTRRQVSLASVFEFKRTKGTPQHVAKGGAFTVLAAPFVKDPDAEDRPEHEQEVDENEITERDVDHWVGALAFAGMGMP